MFVPLKNPDLGPLTINTLRYRSTTGLNGSYSPFLTQPVATKSQWLQSTLAFTKGSSSRIRGTWMCRAYSGRIAREEVLSTGTMRYQLSTSSTWWKRIDYYNGLMSTSDVGQLGNLSWSEYNPTLSALILQSNIEARLALMDAKVSYGESLAEARQTIVHLANTVSRLAKWVSYARRGQWTRIAHDLGLGGHRKRKGIEANWLEYQYAWRPLMKEIYGTIELLKQKMSEEDMVFWVSSKLNRDVTITCSNAGWYPGDAIVLTPTLGVTTSIAARVRDSDIARISSVGLMNPTAVAWAVVPFSFVIDWFIPVGNFLEALSATSGLTFVTGSRTLSVTLDQTVDMPRYWVYNIVDHHDDSVGSLKYQVFGMRRSTLDSFPIALPYVNTRPLRTQQSVSASALLAQSLRKK